ncbi:Outer membrane efflux protein [Pedobacter westerhofensis]|uniref:Outer membrane efflux protein n=2 Tax=Pedobacter westerhofensis TaxID=425512 RepID=A0A521FL13_9SPHI|nr:Outer membrane efflux protein [Pedobacter westerhofensis]
MKTINALYKNQKVTRSDVLRAEVMLSNVQLSLEQADNDIRISNQRLAVLLDLGDSVQVKPTDSAGMPKPALAGLSSLKGQAQTSSYSIQKAKQNVGTLEARLKGTKSAFMPTLSFYTAYGLNYPNNLFFPPVDQAYSIGFVGLKAQYNISSLYHNKHKVEAGKLHISEAEIQSEAVADNVNQEVKSLLIKYGESLNRITVKEKTIDQSLVNYRIVSTKYFNQLALLTDLLDADNLLTASRFDLITAQTDALTIYYRLLYATGKL